VVNVANILTFLWLGFWAIRAAKALAAGERHSILFAIIVHFVLAGIPVLLDPVFGQPEYIFRGLFMCSRDDPTAYIYCGYVAAVPLIWWFTGRLRRPNSTGEHEEISRNSLAFLHRFQPALLLFLVAPVCALLFSRSPGAFLAYGAAGAGGVDTGSLDHSIMSQATVLGIIGAAGILASRARIRPGACLFVLPWVLLAIWFNGKRHIIAYALVLIGYVFWEKGYLRSKRLIAGGVAAAAALFLFSYVYQTSVRDIGDSGGAEALYENMRVDYGRDAEIKLTIFGELYPDTIQILDHRGQSVLFNLGMYIPRSIWEDKPLPYAQYITSAALLRPPKDQGWSLTTSWLEEAIANFGWWGMLIAPLTLSFLCRIGDSCRNSFVGTLTVMLACLFLSVEFVSFAPIFFLWVFLVIWTRRVRLARAPSITLAEPLPNAQLAGVSNYR
jgi:oligosaccharide repeat unit polymerase